MSQRCVGMNDWAWPDRDGAIVRERNVYSRHPTSQWIGKIQARSIHLIARRRQPCLLDNEERRV